MPSHSSQRSLNAASSTIRWFRAPSPSASDGPVFVLLHGVGLSHRSFSRLAAVLARHGDVLAPDLPGFGATRGARRRLSIEEITGMLLPGIDAAAAHRSAPRPLVLVGHSLGVQVAVEVARRRPDPVLAVVLIGPVVDPLASSMIGQGRRLMLDLWAEPPMTGAMVTRDYARGGLFSYAAGVTSMLRYDILTRLPDVPAPVLVLRGRHDPVAPRRWVARLAHTASDGRAADIDGAAVHNVVHSRPAETAQAILAFVESLRAR